MQWDFISQGHAEDVLLWHRFNYYVRGVSLISDTAFDALERSIKARWSVSACSDVGSDFAGDYPRYIQEGRRPNADERMERDKAIAQRWMEAL